VSALVGCEDAATYDHPVDALEVVWVDADERKSASRASSAASLSA
jgi:hypothetical protein